MLNRSTMKTLLALAAVAGFGSAASAAVFTYDTANASNTTWNGTSTGWFNSSGGSAVWGNTTSDTAYFAGTGKTVTVGTVNAGGLQFDSSGYTLTGGTITLGATATINTNNSGTTTINSILAGAGTSLTKSGSGTLSLGGANTFTGNMTINANSGVVVVNLASAANTATALGNMNVSRTITINSGSTLEFDKQDALGAYNYATVAQLIADGGTITHQSSIATSVAFTSLGAVKLMNGAHLTAQNGNSATVGSFALNGTVTVAGTSGSFIDVAASQNSWSVFNLGTVGGSTTFDVGSTGATTDLTVSAVLADKVLGGAGGLIKTGAGKMVLSGSNTFTGNITINNGMLAVATTQANNTSPTVSTLGNMTTSGRTITVNSGGTLRFDVSDAIGAYNYKTPVTLIADGGTITRVSGGTGFNSIGDVTLKNGAHLTTVNGNASSVGSFGLNGNVTVSGTSGSFIDTLAGQTTNTFINLGYQTGSTTFDVAATGDATADLTVSAILDNPTLHPSGGTASVIKAGAGKMVLSAANTYAGGTTLRAGTIVASNANALGSSGTVTLTDTGTSTNNTTLLLGNVNMGRAITVANNGSGTVTLGANGAVATPTFSGAITLNKNVTLDGSTNTDRLTFTGGIGGTGNVTVIGNRVVFATTANTYAGTMTINSGSVLQLSDGTATATSFLPDSYGLTVTGTLKLAKGGNTEAIGGLSGAGIVEAISGSDTLSVGGGDATAAFSGVLRNNGATLAFTKTGLGTQTLSGTNTYTGATTINAGTLNVAGSLASGSAVSLASGATLKGTGTVGGTVTVANGTAVIGDSASTGTLTLGGLTFNGTGSVNIGTLSNYTASASAINVTGTLTLSGSTITINLPAGSLSTGTYHLISHANTLADLNGLTVSGPTVGARQSAILTNNTGMIDYVVAGDSPYWTGATDGAWDTSSANWKLITAGTTTQYISNDTVLFNDNATGTTTVSVASNVSPASVAFANSSKNYTLTGAAGIAGSTGLDKSGTGTLTINNANSYAGATTINGGTIALGNDGALGTSAVSLNTNGTLDLGSHTVSNAIALNGGALAFNGATLSGNLTGTGALTVANNLTLSGSNSYSGGTTLNAGMLTVTNANSLGTGALTFGGNSTLQLNGSFSSSRNYVINNGVTGTIDTNGNTLTHGGLISGAGALTKAGSGTLVLSSSNSYTGATTINTGAVVLGNSGALGGSAVTLNTNGTLDVGAYAVANNIVLGGGTLAYSSGATLSGSISESGVHSLTVANNLTLSGSNSYSGGTVVNAGTLTVGNVHALGTGTVNVNGGTLTANAAVTGIGTVTLASGTISGSGSLSGSSYTVDAGTISAILAGTGGLTKSTTGTVTISTRATYTGATTINAGTLELATPQYARALKTSGITVNNGGTLNLNGTNLLHDNGSPNVYTPITVNGGGTVALVSTATDSHNHFGALTLNGGVIWGKSTSPIVGQYSSFDVDITVGGSATSEIKSDNASWGFGLPGMRTFTVASTGDASGVDLLVSCPLIDVGGVIKAGTGNMKLTGSNTYAAGTTVNSGTLTVGNAHALSTGAVTLSGGTLDVGNYTVTNAITLGGGALAFNGATLSGNISETGGAKSLTVGANLTLSGSNSYSGGTTVNAGTLTAGSVHAFGTGTITVNGGTLDLASHVIGNTINYQSGVMANVNNATTTHVLSGATLSSATSVTIGGTTIVDNGGTLNTNNMTLGTTVVDAGGILKGTGTVGALTVNGTLAPGNSPGILTATGDTAWASGSYLWEVGQVDPTVQVQPNGGTWFDLLSVTGGTLTITDGFVVDVSSMGATPTSWDPSKSYSWTIASTTGGVFGDLNALKNNMNLTSFTAPQDGSATWSFTLANGNNDLVLNYIVPEPGTLGLLALGALALLGRRRNRR